MRIALATAGSRGDVQPMLAFALRLKEAGHDVVLCAPPDFADLVARTNIAYRPAGTDFESILRRHAGGLNHPLRVLREVAPELQRELGLQADAFYGAATGADLLVGASLFLAGRSVAEAHGKPYRHVLYCPQAIPSRAHQPPLFPWSRCGAVLNRVMWWLHDRVIDRLYLRAINDVRRKLGLGPVASATTQWILDGVIVPADGELAVIPADARVQAIQTGAWLLPRDPALPAEVDAFLAAGEAPVYVGFGSMAEEAPRRTTELIVRVAHLCRKRLVLGTGWAGLGRGELPGDCLAVGDVPHAALFPRMAAVVHHGGAGTTATAARAGVPQVVVPHFLDQFYWADRVWRTGIGPRPIHRKRLTPESLSRAIRHVLEDQRCRERARVVQARLSRADGVSQAVAYVSGLDPGFTGRHQEPLPASATPTSGDGGRIR